MISCTFEDGNKASLRHTTVDTIVLKEEKILLVKRTPELLEGGKWGLVGGFVDRNENLTEAVEREVLEETGYYIQNIVLLGVNDSPSRPHEDRQNIAFVYYCEAGEKVGKSDKESTEQKWFDIHKLPDESQIAFDHYKNIQNYLKFKNGDINIPIFS